MLTPRLVMLQHTHGTPAFLVSATTAAATAVSSAAVVVVAAAITSLSPAGDNVTHQPRNFVTLNTRVTGDVTGCYHVTPCHVSQAMQVTLGKQTTRNMYNL